MNGIRLKNAIGPAVEACRARDRACVEMSHSKKYLWEATKHSERLNQVKSLSPHHRFVIALPSPDKVTETGLRMCPREKCR
jgi:hypothetical protein